MTTATQTTSPFCSDERSSTRIVCGPHSPLLDILGPCRRIASSDATVLLTGETGTGKEVFARYIHEHSPRFGKPLVALNCAAIPESLLESELFGHVRGAFTGALTARRGRIAAAEGGTLFLDEIGEMPLPLQAKLLRVIQERRYEPVGSTESVSADFRLVVATHRDLAAEIELGRFRRDLYYRLLVCPVDVPPLRHRAGDVARLFEHFWALRRERRPVAPEVIAALEAYEWPGNVRELENLVERLSVCSAGASIGLADLPPYVARCARAAPPPARLSVVAPELLSAPTPVEASHPVAPADPAPDRPFASEPSLGAAPLAAPPAPSAIRRRLAEGEIDLQRLLRETEASFIDAALERTGGNRKAAADLLGLQRTTLVEKLRRRHREALGA